MLPKNYQVEKNHESYRRNNCKNNHENNYTRKTAKKQHKLFLIFLLLVFISSSLNPLSSYAAGTGSVGTSAGQSNVGTGQPSLFALLEETALGAGFVPLGVNEPASVTFTVNATEDASFINGVKFTLEDVVVGGTDDKGDPLVYESVSVGLPNHLTMANSFSLPTDWVCIQSGGNITIWTIFNPETSGTKAIVEDFLTNTYAAQLTSRASATSLKDYDFPDSGETIGVKVSASVSPSSWNEAFVPQPVIAQHRNVLSGLTLSEDVLYIGKIGEAYLTQPITPPPAHYYAGVKQYSAPAAGTFTSDRQWVEHIYDNTYPVVYDPNSASAEGQMSDSTVRHGEDFMLKPNYYTLQGYTFEGWNTEPDGSGDFYADYHEFTPWQFTSTLTLYAQWRSDNIVLILDKNADNAIVGITQLNHLVYGQTLTAQGVDIFVAPPVRPFPYQVIGWATTKALADAGTADFTNDSLVDWLDTKTIYAVWGTQPPSGNVEVTFDANGGTAASPASVTATVGEPYGTFPNTTRPWHYLIGWYTDPIGGSQVEETTVVTDASDHTLYAHWEMLPLVLCGLEFDKNAADATAGSVTQMTVGMGPSLRDQGMTLPDTGSGAPTRPGYEFAGWATTPELADAYIADFTDDSPVDWLRSKTVYAIWVGAQVEVTFDANGGAVMSPGRLAVIFGGSYGTLLSASRPGYDFAGWFTEPTGGTQVTAVTMVTNYSNHTLYAHWSPVSGGGSNIDLTFSVNITASAAVTNGYEYTLENAVVNGTDVNGAPLTYGSVSITLPHGLTLESFSFFPPSGWVMTQAGNSATWIISNPATNGTKAIVEDFLNNRFFATLTTADVFPDDDTKIIVEVNEGQIPTWVDPNGFVHYYEYVPASGITWLNAYNAAKARTYNGLPGYLMTITSQEEQDFIYGSIGKTMGFMGGTRAVHDSSKAKILDDASLSTNTNDFDKEFTYGVEWYWACGPEAGLVFYGKPTVSMAGTGSISGVYSNWYSTEPDAYGGGAEKAAFL
ncbi:MAG: InlB B-repeat-containing protein, partial [Coriobacteriales bacterium]|nr:InlB B-repeat-containing protein [Coriobacteriales bacterium]